MSFDEWYYNLPDDEKAALCKYDVWKGALNSAIEKLIEEQKVLIRHNLKTNANGVTACIAILKKII